MTNAPQQAAAADTQLVDRYLDLLARTLTRYGTDSPLRPLAPLRRSGLVQKGWQVVATQLARRSLALSRVTQQDLGEREIGHDVPVLAETAVGLKRLANIRYCVETVLADGVPGDLLEAGVWRGGTVIYMLGVLAAHGARRVVWAADSYEGMPVPDLEKYPHDADQWLHLVDSMAVARSTVEASIKRYGLLSEDVRFLEGWFKDTLPGAPVEQLSVLRLDADMYESTMQVLDTMYDKVSPGGFVIVDDYGCFEACKRAIDEFRAARGITDAIEVIDWTGVYWRKGA